MYSTSAGSATNSSQVVMPSGVGEPSTGMCTAPESPGSAARSFETVAPTSKVLPPYRYPSTAISTVGEIWVNRSITDPGPKSGEHEDHTAPSAEVARNPTSA